MEIRSAIFSAMAVASIGFGSAVALARVAPGGSAIATTARFEASAENAANPESYIDRFIDYPPEINEGVIADLWSPVRNTDGSESFPVVNSKWEQPRDAVGGTTPHQGVDLNTAMYTPVYPIEVGWIVYQSGYNPDYTCCFNGETAATAKFEMVIQIDWNYNGIQDDPLYLKFDHLETVGFIPTNSYVSTSTMVAESGNENGGQPIHLHFGFIYPKEVGANTGRWTGMYSFYTFAPAWEYGRDMDYIAQWGLDPSNNLRFYAYIVSNGARQSLSTSDVTVYHRAAGSSTWSALAVRGEFDPHAFNASLNGLYAPGTTIQFLMRALRPGIVEPHNASFFPPRYAHPNNNPNAVVNPYPYYSTTAQ